MKRLDIRIDRLAKDPGLRRHPSFDAKKLPLFELGDQINRSVVLVGGVTLNEPAKIGTPWHGLVIRSYGGVQVVVSTGPTSQ
jgi:hypothetical protein